MIRVRRAAPLILIGALAGCLPEPVTSEGEQIAWLYGLFMVAAAVVFGIVAGLIGWSVVRYRAGADASLPSQTRANTALELTWWALPTVLVVVLGIATITVLARVDAPPPDDALVVEVDAFQWGWRFTYPEAGVSVVGNATEPPWIRLPLHRPVVFVLRSSDVVHSFHVPHFLVKRDNVPGRENRLTVVIEEEGTYSGQCAEFCGLLHHEMLFLIDGVPPEDFDAWLAAQGEGR